MNKYINILPNVIQDTLVSIYNSYQYKIRQGGKYSKLRKYYAKVDNLDEKMLAEEIDYKKNIFLSIL